MHQQQTIQEVKVMESFCEICGNSRDSFKCGQNPEPRCYVRNYNRNVMSNTYNPAWKKNNLPPGSFQNWTDLCCGFLAKFSYSNMTDKLRNEITLQFCQYNDKDDV
ncbi:hypothetical protein V6N13_142033 [Hibiscus sabdariffa]